MALPKKMGMSYLDDQITRYKGCQLNGGMGTRANVVYIAVDKRMLSFAYNIALHR